MVYLPYKEPHLSVNSYLNLFNAENVDVSVKHGYYGQFYPQQPLSENVHFPIYYSEDYFIDLNSRFIDLHVIFQKSNNENKVHSRDYPRKIVYCTIFLGKSVSTKMEPWLAQATIFQIMKLYTFYADDFNVL